MTILDLISIMEQLGEYGNSLDSSNPKKDKCIELANKIQEYLNSLYITIE